MARSSSRTTLLAVAVGVALAVALALRNRDDVFGDRSDRGAPAEDAAAATLADAATRCLAEPPRLLADDGSLAPGSALVADSGTFVVGALRTTPAGGRAVVLVARPGAVAPQVVDLGTAGGDDPAPRPLLLGDGTLLAASLVTSRTGRELRVVRLGAVDALAATPAPAGTFAMTRDESLAFDVAASGAHALVAWDDDESGRGVVRLGRVGAGDAGGPVRVSPPTSDAEAPRLVVLPSGGAYVAWIARRPEGDGGADFLERAAEGPESRWVEVAYLPPGASAPESVLRLSPSRVSDLDVDVAEGDSLAVVMRDEEVAGAVTGSARVARQLVRREREGGPLAASPPVQLAPLVGARDPAWVLGASGTLALAGDLAERTLVLATSAPPAPPGATAVVEPAFDGVRPLAARTLGSLAQRPAGARGFGGPVGLSGNDFLVLGVTATARSTEARVVLCRR